MPSRSAALCICMPLTLAVALQPARACETVDGIMCSLVPPDNNRTAGAPALRDRVEQALQSAWFLANGKNFDRARAKVEPLVKLSHQTREEISAIDLTLAFIAFSANDAAGVTQAFSHSLDAGVVTKAELPSRLAVLTQLYFQARNYPKAIEMGERYVRDVEPDADILVIVGKSRLVAKEYPEAAVALRAAQDAAAAAKIPLKEDWLRFAVTAEFYAHNMPGVIANLERLQALYPKPQYAADLAKYTASQTAAAP